MEIDNVFYELAGSITSIFEPTFCILKCRRLSMPDLAEIWEIILTHMPKDRALSLKEVFRIIEHHADLGPDDFEPEAHTSKIPKWKRNVRNVLQYRTETGEINWDRDTIYLLAERDV